MAWDFIQQKKNIIVNMAYQNVIILKLTYKSTRPAGFYSCLPFRSMIICILSVAASFCTLYVRTRSFHRLR